MFYESFSLVRSKGANNISADESEQLGMAGRLVALLIAVVIAGSTIFAVSMPFALLHLR